MAEPTTTAASGTILAAVAAFMLELTGVDLPPIVWAFIGAALMQGYSVTPVGRWRAISQVLTSGFMGALLGTALAHLGNIEVRSVVLLMCAVGGAGAHPIMQTLVSRFVKKVEAHE